MSRNKLADKEKDKDKAGQFAIRIAKSERAAFIALCERMDTTAAREIRRFIHEFIAASTPPVAVDGDGKDADLPDPKTVVPATVGATAETPFPVADAPTIEVAAGRTEISKKTRKRAKS